MNAFDVYRYIEEKHKTVVTTIRMKKLCWSDFIERANYSISLNGGELRTAAKKETADEFIKVLIRKFAENPDFVVSIMCGPWLVEGEEAQKGEDPAINNTLRELYKLSLENQNYNIYIYCNPLNVLESTEAGYMHSVIIDEGKPTQEAYLEYPHGCPKNPNAYKRHKWMNSKNVGFINDVIRTRKNFCKQWGIEQQTIETAYRQIREWTFIDFYTSTEGWNYSTRLGFGNRLKKWLNGSIHPPAISAN